MHRAVFCIDTLAQKFRHESTRLERHNKAEHGSVSFMLTRINSARISDGTFDVLRDMHAIEEIHKS